VVSDTESQLITAVDVIPGNAHDSAMTTELIAQSEENVGLAVAETVGDCAYGTGESRREFSESGRKIIAPVPASPKNGRIPKTSFRIGRKEDLVTCPAGLHDPAIQLGKSAGEGQWPAVSGEAIPLSREAVSVLFVAGTVCKGQRAPYDHPASAGGNDAACSAVSEDSRLSGGETKAAGRRASDRAVAAIGCRQGTIYGTSQDALPVAYRCHGR